MISVKPVLVSICFLMNVFLDPPPLKKIYGESRWFLQISSEILIIVSCVTVARSVFLLFNLNFFMNLLSHFRLNFSKPVLLGASLIEIVHLIA